MGSNKCIYFRKTVKQVPWKLITKIQDQPIRINIALNENMNIKGRFDVSDKIERNEQIGKMQIMQL